MTSFAEIDLPHNAFYAQKVRAPGPLTPQSPRPHALTGHADSQACLHLFVTISICANLMCTASTTFVSVWGSGKALRGKVCAQHSAHGGLRTRPALLPPYPASLLPPYHLSAFAAGRVHVRGRRWNERRARLHLHLLRCAAARPTHMHGQPTCTWESHATRWPRSDPNPHLTSGVGLITTLLALMSAAWILMTLEVAFVVRPLHPACTTQPCMRAPCRHASHPQPPPHPQATCGVSWSIYVIVRQVRRPPRALRSSVPAPMTPSPDAPEP